MKQRFRQLRNDVSFLDQLRSKLEKHILEKEMKSIKFEFLKKSKECKLSDDWAGYRIYDYTSSLGLNTSQYKNGSWQPPGGRPHEMTICSYNTDNQEMMLFIQEVAQTIGADLVLVRQAPETLPVHNPVHPNRKNYTEAIVAFAKSFQKDSKK